MTRKYIQLSMILISVMSLVIPAMSCTGSQTEQSVPEKQQAIKQAEFQISPIIVEPKWLFVGDNATVYTRVTNTGGVDGVYKAVLSVDGQNSGEQEITVPKGQAKEISFLVTSATPGVKSIAVRDVKSEVNFFTGQQPYTIQYGSYEMQLPTPESTWIAIEPYGQIVRFTAAAKPFRISKIQVAAMASLSQNKQFTINIWDLNRKKLWTKDFPWGIFQSSLPIWQDLDVPNIPVADDFYVELVSHTPANQVTGQDVLMGGTNSFLGLGFNKSDYETRSTWSYQGQQYRQNYEAQRKLNFCISVQGEGSSLRVLYYDDAGADMYKASSDFSYAVNFTAPSYPFDLRLIQLFAYRDTKEAGEQFVTLKVIDKASGQVIWQKSIPWSEITYSGIKLGNWVDIDTGGVTSNHDFYIEVTTNSGSDNAIWLGCDTTAKNRYSDMSAGGNIITWREWKDTIGTDIKTYSRDNTKWMIRAAGIAK